MNRIIWAKYLINSDPQNHRHIQVPIYKIHTHLYPTNHHYPILIRTIIHSQFHYVQTQDPEI